MPSGPVPLCASCTRYSPAAAGLIDDALPTCSAFNNGIPEEVLLGGFDHRQPFPGDGGILYDPDELRAADLAAYEEFKRTAARFALDLGDLSQVRAALA